ncbi:MAG: DNA-3-methyladenine glycosylase [Oscillospiraceae bacterium]|nr:DNA-3-methyladenine glycosylase [Oscillospiraceae bacterium]
MIPQRLPAAFFHRDCLEVAPALVGKLLVRRLPNGTVLTERIAETEAYRGTEDLACHASKGRTKRTELLYRESGVLYVYLCYGVHWLMNVITGEPEEPQGVLLRAGVTAGGPGRLTKLLQVDGRFNGRSILTQESLWIADDGFSCTWHTDVRVGIDYAGEYWKSRPWRFVMDGKEGA